LDHGKFKEPCFLCFMSPQMNFAPQSETGSEKLSTRHLYSVFFLPE
jgi:hypothetical protein